MKTLSFVPSDVHQRHYVHINGEFTGIVVNMHSYNTNDQYKSEVNFKINLLIEGRL